MKIAAVNITPVAFADPPLLNSNGLHQPYALRTIVEIVSDSGLSGFGECAGGEKIYNDFQKIAPILAGHDPFNLNRLRQTIEAGEAQTGSVEFGALMGDMAPLGRPEVVYGALEVAALDLQGKALGLPVAELLGGRVRDRVQFSAYLFYKLAGGGGTDDDLREDEWGEAVTPQGIVDQAKRMFDRYGFGSVKFKGGVFPPAEEIEAVHAMYRQFGPDVPLRIDPNAAWTVPTSVEVGRQLAGELEYLEDPTAGLIGMAEVRKMLMAEGIDTPLATNMVVTRYSHIQESVERGSVQVILGDHHIWGGLRATVELGRLCQTFGIGMSMHSNSHLGISLMAMTHVAAATPHLTYACDTHYPWQDAGDEIVQGGRIRFIDGCVDVPTTPGLGIEIDRDALARGRERYEHCGIRERDDIIEMRRRVDRTWERKLPRW